VMKYGREQLGMKRIAAITTQDNEASIKLLGRLGLKFERLIEMPTGEVLNLFIADA
jgi:RimJ/RimL family protein N-acetyltransferase